jgi:hypothetical protein
MDSIQQSHVEFQEDLSKLWLDFQLFLNEKLENFNNRWDKRSWKLSTNRAALSKSPKLSSPNTPISISQAPVTPFFLLNIILLLGRWCAGLQPPTICAKRPTMHSDTTTGLSYRMVSYWRPTPYLANYHSQLRR